MITVGKKRPAKEKLGQVQSSANVQLTQSSASYKAGMMVALRLARYFDEIPQIGKIIELTESDVTVEWWIGGYSNPWVPWKKKNEPISETFHRNAILCGGVSFTRGFRLQPEAIKKLRSLYASKELI